MRTLAIEPAATFQEGYRRRHALVSTSTVNTALRRLLSESTVDHQEGLYRLAILDRGEPGRPYNVGSPEGLSIRELAETLRSALGTKNEISIKGTFQPFNLSTLQPSTYVPIVTRAETKLGLNVTVPLAEAIRLSAV